MSLNQVELFDAVPGTVLAIYAHPDDADVACGGSLARWSEAGATVHVLLLTDGGKGTFDSTVSPKKLAKLRRKEVDQSSSALGIKNVESLNIPDGEVASTADLVEILVSRIRTIRPDVVLGHDPTAVFFGSVYVNHQDHRAAGWALLDAVAPASGMPHYFPATGLAHRVSDVLLTGTLDPDCYVDVTNEINKKIEAVTAHRSQLSDDIEWVAESIRQQASRDGQAVGVGFAEGFRHLRLDA